MSAFNHVPVLPAETLDGLAPRDGGLYADLTLGGGGHAQAVLEASAPTGKLVGVDRDETALVAASARLQPFCRRTQFFHGAFGDFAALAAREHLGPFDGVLADVGVSSPQLDDSQRGFSFRESGPLDMRMDRSAGVSAKDFIAARTQDELADVIYEFGEERRSRPIARSIKDAEHAGELETTADLARAVRRVFGGARSRIDPATRTFQAIRIAVNDELRQLDRLLASIPDLLSPGGRFAVISFHSLEDRRVKWAFRKDERLSPLTKKPIVAGEAERATNPRSRTAKLRVAERRQP
ncbi:MAG: 16S rRNA (cytosine(1402)-N(4))-methyltransferase RsmH [Myxococcota bacterium]